jgi:hypothetical protein
MFTPAEGKVDMPVTITDVPRLDPDGGGCIEITTGDVSVPCVGVFSSSRKRGLLLFTVQQLEGLNLGLTYHKGMISLTWPSSRGSIYRWPFMTDESDSGHSFKAGERYEIPYRLFDFPCEDITGFFRMFFENRKCMGLDMALPRSIPVEEQFRIQRDKFNKKNWSDAMGAYTPTVLDNGGIIWQPGWIGGALTSYALMKLGGALETMRAVTTLDYLFSTQTGSGFFYDGADAEGKLYGAGFGTPGCEDWFLIRKAGDVLLFLFKHFEVMRERDLEISTRHLEGARRLADGCVRLWETFGQFGQFVDTHTGKITVGGSTSGAIIPAGLAKAAAFFGDRRYLEVAKQGAEQYYRRDAMRGVTTGGPGEILQGPDSESAFGLLESMALLYESTGEAKWLDYARHAAHLCASWVVSYNYRFPDGSEFARLDIKTVGTVFANVQNKHSAPGICTLSGDSLYKLYRWTGEEAYRELLRDIALAIPQCMSTAERPIYSWNAPKDSSLMFDESLTPPSEQLPSGYICERVNMSDWEGQRCVGGVFNGSCWPETSNLLTLAEVDPQWLEG